MQLVINTYGSSLRRKGDRFVVKAGERQVAFSAQKVQSIVIATGAHFSSNVVELASQHNVDIVFLDKQGNPTARVWQTRLGSTATIRRRQIEAAETDEGLRLVRDWTSSKLANQNAFLKELQQRRPDHTGIFDSPLKTLTECRDKITKLTGTVDEIRNSLMGLEGSAGRVYFTCLGHIVPAEYQFTGRSRQPASDPFNAMLNYAYGVLYSLVERSLILAGLDPFVGFLHTDNYNKKSLVFDMIEPFRIIAERATVLIFTGRRAKTEFFREVPGGIELAPDGRAYLIAELNKRLDRTVRYQVQTPRHLPRDTRPTPSPPASEPSDVAESDITSNGEASKPNKPKFRKLKQRTIIQHEAHALANTLLGRNDIPRIVETESLWQEPAP
ncbi:MAG: CRISPR-associated endonuclease Cas1 [Candidatus Paceibacterota bacterium]